MAIVKEYTTPEETTIRFNDEAYRDKTPEELEAVMENIRRTAYEVLVEALEMKAERARKAEQGETA